MLYNDDKRTPGRYILVNIIDDQIQRCNCELFFRWLKDSGKDTFVFISEIKRVLDDSDKEVLENINQIPLSAMTSGIPEEFASLPIPLILDGGMDKLGRFNRDHITLNFILKQGIWLTSEELKELAVKDPNTGELIERLDVIKERLLPTVPKENIPLKITPKGLSYSQLSSMLSLRSCIKTVSFTEEQKQEKARHMREIATKKRENL